LPPEQVRRPYIVGATKVPYEQRDVAHAVITPADDRGFFNVIGADDHDDAGHTLPVGSNVTYRVELTDSEAETFRQASNCRFVELDGESAAGATTFPSAASLRFMDADFSGGDAFHGRDVLVGLLDGGTTSAVRSYLGVTMVDRKVFGPDDPGPDEITSQHGCMVAPCLVPQGGKFLDAVVAGNSGSAPNTALAAGARWCADLGAKIINHSYSATAASSIWNDVAQYLLDRGVQWFCSMGNDAKNVAYYPAALSTTFPNIHSSISFDETTGKRSTFSNYTATASGCAPGTNVLGLSPAAATITISGTSFSSPHMARLCAMGATGAVFTPTQVGAALKSHTRNTGQPVAEQGGGAYDLKAALVSLNALATVNAGADIQLTPGAVFTRTATEADFATGSIASRAWTVVAVPAGAPAVASLVGTTIGTAAALSWTTPATPGGYRLRYAAKNTGGATLAFDEVAVAVATNPAVPGTNPIVIDPDPIPSAEAFGVPTLVVEARTLPEVPTLPGFTRSRAGDVPPRQPGPAVPAEADRLDDLPGAGDIPRCGHLAGLGPRPDAPPPFDVEFFLLDDAGGYRCSLPDVKAFTITDVANAALSVSFDYPVDGLNFAALREHVDAGVDATVAVRFAGTAEWELQAILSECDGDDVADAAVWQFRGGGSLLDEAVVYPDPGTADGKVTFTNASPGAIVTELVGRAQARGGLDIDTSTFSDGYDSHGQPWPADLISSPSFAPGDSSTYLRVLQLLTDAGLSSSRCAAAACGSTSRAAAGSTAPSAPPWCSRPAGTCSRRPDGTTSARPSPAC
jgi:hypothetical protein